jgi:hypothetical protein
MTPGEIAPANISAFSFRKPDILSTHFKIRLFAPRSHSSLSALFSRITLVPTFVACALPERFVHYQARSPTYHYCRLAGVRLFQNPGGCIRACIATSTVLVHAGAELSKSPYPAYQIVVSCQKNPGDYTGSSDTIFPRGLSSIAYQFGVRSHC